MVALSRKRQSRPILRRLSSVWFVTPVRLALALPGLRAAARSLQSVESED
jgi:hypothetical protein